MSKDVGQVRVDYRLTDRSCLALELVLEEPDCDLETWVYFVDGFGKDRATLMGPGVTLLRFYQSRQPTVFAESFPGFTLLHRVVYGPQAGRESRPLLVCEPVPLKLRRASKKKAAPKAKPAPKAKGRAEAAAKRRPAACGQAPAKAKAAAKGKGKAAAKRKPAASGRASAKPAAKRQRRA